MEDARQQGRDRTTLISTSTSTSSGVAGGRPVKPDNSTEQLPFPKDERIVSANPSDAAITGSPRDLMEQPQSLDMSGAPTAICLLNAYCPQEHTFYRAGYDNSNSNWDEYTHYVNTNGLQVAAVDQATPYILDLSREGSFLEVVTGLVSTNCEESLDLVN